MLSLAFKIVKEDYENIPEHYSIGLKNLLRTMLWKEDHMRPSCNEIINMDILQKYLKELVITKGTALKNIRSLDAEATATAQLLQGNKILPEEVKKKPSLTPKQMIAQRKQESAKNRENELAKAANQAFVAIEK